VPPDLGVKSRARGWTPRGGEIPHDHGLVLPHEKIGRFCSPPGRLRVCQKLAQLYVTWVQVNNQPTATIFKNRRAWSSQHGRVYML